MRRNKSYCRKTGKMRSAQKQESKHKRTISRKKETKSSSSSSISKIGRNRHQEEREELPWKNKEQ